MQIPENFGHSEDWSGLDFFGTTLSLASGHPEAAISILARKPARSTLLSEPYQKAIVNQQPRGVPLPLITNPGATAVVPPNQQVQPSRPFWELSPWASPW
jgi:hypothetical protein